MQIATERRSIAPSAAEWRKAAEADGTVMGTSDPTIEMRGVTKRLGGNIAVGDVSMAIKPGEFVTILGPSGSGKTTLLNLAAGFISPDSGSIVMNGEEVTAVPAYKRNIGMVFQSYALFPHMTVLENISYPLHVRGMHAADVVKLAEAALERVRMRGFSGRYPHQLSGGQQQRVALARATVFDPPLILMDEPLGALDKRLRQEMQSEIKRMHREIKSAIIYVTHDQDEALAMSDRIIVMNQGLIVQSDRPDRLYARPASMFVAQFLGDANFVDVAVNQRGTESCLIQFRGSTRRVDGEAPAASACVAFFRPEDMHIRPAAAPRAMDRDEMSWHPGIVREYDYLGSESRFVVESDEALLTIKQRGRPGSIGIDDAVSVGLDWSMCTLLPKE